MAIYKRVAGNVVITTIGNTDTITIQGVTANTATVIIDGNLSVSGNATLSGNISGDNLFNGTSSIAIPVANGNANITIGGTSNVAVFATTGQFVTGLVSVTGNITGANLITAGLITATGNITGANINTGGNILLSQTSDAASDRTIRFSDANTVITTVGANIGAVEWFTSDATGATARVTAAIRAVYSDINGNANILFQSNAGSNTTRLAIIGASGNVGVANTAPLHTFAVSGNTYVSGTATVIGNVTPGNLTTAGQVSATANVTGGNLVTGGAVSATGNVTANNVVILTGATAGTAGFSATGNVTGGNVNSNDRMSATGNVYAGGNLVTQGYVSATGNLLGLELRTANANVSGNSYGAGIGVENIVWQSASFDISTPAMANIGVLQFSALANQAYKFESLMYVTTNGSSTTTAFSVNFPSGSCNYTVESQTGAAASWAAATSSTSDTTGTTQSMAATTAQRAVRINGTFFHTANTTVILRAQTSLANVTVASGSHLTYTRIG
jgi:hypothetical protein